MSVTLNEQENSLVFQALIQPRASKNAIVGEHGGALKIRLTAPPVDGAANKMCLKFLAKWLGLPKSSLTIVAGETSRNKRIRIMLSDSDKLEEMKRIKQMFQAI